MCATRLPACRDQVWGVLAIQEPGFSCFQAVLLHNKAHNRSGKAAQHTQRLEFVSQSDRAQGNHLIVLPSRH